MEGSKNTRANINSEFNTELERRSLHLPGTSYSALICHWLMDDTIEAYLFEYDSISKDNAICQIVIRELPPQTRRNSLLNPLNCFSTKQPAKTLIFMTSAKLS